MAEIVVKDPFAGLFVPAPGNLKNNGAFIAFIPFPPWSLGSDSWAIPPDCRGSVTPWEDYG
jgi:hypothetical protein